MFKGWSMRRDVSQEIFFGLKHIFISVGKWIQTLPILKIGVLWCVKYFEQKCKYQMVPKLGPFKPLESSWSVKTKNGLAFPFWWF
jgi:hypothetical protein